jgi:two-component system nitrogen regulation response regulator NtrX
LAIARPARELVGRSLAVARVQEHVDRAARAEGGVLLVAPAGVDVESVARELHRQEGRSAPFERVECGIAEPARLERVLFGASAPAVLSDLEWVASDSRIAATLGGTMFLRDVTELPASLQARIARVARDTEVRIDGAPTPTRLRWIASAAPGIDADVEAGRLRRDLYRRLAASRIELPPLGDRAEDVPLLAVRLLEEWCAVQDRDAKALTQPALALLSALAWPGNLAELQITVERAAQTAPGDGIQIEDILGALKLDRLTPLDRPPAGFVPLGSLRDARLRFERDYIASVLRHHGWNIADAARALGIQRPNLYRKARQLGIPLARAAE